MFRPSASKNKGDQPYSNRTSTEGRFDTTNDDDDDDSDSDSDSDSSSSDASTIANNDRESVLDARISLEQGEDDVEMTSRPDVDEDGDDDGGIGGGGGSEQKRDDEESGTSQGNEVKVEEEE